MSSGAWDLQRFVEAQATSFARARAELAAGKKRSHWMWFVFPQMRGLGTSAAAERYGIAGRAEAEAYLRHPLLGDRLVDCTRLVAAIHDEPLREIFGSPDDLKFISSMTHLRCSPVGQRSLCRSAWTPRRRIARRSDTSTPGTSGPALTRQAVLRSIDAVWRAARPA